MRTLSAGLDGPQTMLVVLLLPMLLIACRGESDGETEQSTEAAAGPAPADRCE